MKSKAVDIRSQRMINTAIVAVVKVDNHSGSIGAACDYLTEIMAEDSKDLGDRVFGSIWASTIGSDYEWTSKTLAYLTLVRKQYTYDF